MSKHRPPTSPASASTGAATPDSAITAILSEKVRLRLEIVRRLEYQQVLDLRARLAELPPIPPDHEPPANED